MMLLAALLGLLSAQDPAANAAPPAPDDGWREVDRVVMVVNQDVFTLLELQRDLRTAARNRKLTTETELRAAERQILGERVRERLAVQAGSNLGLDERIMDVRVEESLERMRERENGVLGLARFLESRDVSGQEVRQRLRDDLYAQIWRDGETGEGLGPLGRRTRDNWVRPGQLRTLYQQALERPQELEAIGGSVARLKFQQIVIDPAQAGGAEVARDLATALGKRIEAGEDMTALVRTHGLNRDGDGISEVEQDRLRDLFPEIHAFASRARAGEVAVLSETGGRGKPLIRVVRLLERTPARTPDLAERSVQETLRKRAVERMQAARLEAAYAELMRASFVWPPEVNRAE